MKIKLVKSEYLGDIYFVIYLFLFSMLKPITSSSPQISTYVLLGGVAVLLFLTIVNNRLSRKMFTQWALTSVLILGWLSFDFVVRHNSMQVEIYYNFMLYGILPLFFLSSVRNYKIVLKAYTTLSIVVGIVFLADPFMNYRWSSTYMEFGLTFMLPAFCGALIALFCYKKKPSIIPCAIFLIEMIICGNKSVIITAGVLLVAFYCFFNPGKRIYTYMKVILIAIAAVLVYFFRLEILDIFIGISKDLGLNSYALSTFRIMLAGESSLVYNTRLSIWEDAWQQFLNSPILGQGFGYFESLSSFSTGYVHNIELDILVASGLIGGMIYIFLFVKSIIKLVKCKNRDKQLLLVVLMISWFVPMQFSLSLWKVMNFWVYWGVCYFRNPQTVGEPYEYPVVGSIIGSK